MKNKKVWLFAFYGAITIAILCIFLGANDFGATIDTLASADLRYVFVALALLLVYLALSPLSTCILARSRGLDVKFGMVYSISMTEHFFNGITPFATGGQPFQMYEFSRAKIRVAESTGLLLMNFIIMMVATNLFAVLSLFYFNKFIAENTLLQVVATVGFSMNFLVLAFMILVATSKKVSGAIYYLAFNLCKIKFIKRRLEGKLPALKEYLDNMQTAFKGLLADKKATLFAFVVRVITMAVYYAITFYVLRALNVAVEYKDLFFVICGTSFAITAVVFLPTPGSAGGIEFAFSSIFSSLAGGILPSIATGGTLIWRLLTYYITMIISLIFYVGLEIYFNNRAKKISVDSVKALQNDTTENVQNGAGEDGA